MLMVLWSGTGTVAMAGPAFLGLGDLPGGGVTSRAYALSADGSTVVGQSQSTQGTEAFRWTVAEGMVGLGTLPGTRFSSQAFDVSADGSTIVGTFVHDDGVNAAFRWTQADGMQPLGNLPGGPPYGIAYGVSADGNTVVGRGWSASGPEAFVWDATSGMMGLGDLPGGAFDSIAADVSADGTVVVGSSNGEHHRGAFRWTESEGMIDLGTLPGSDRSTGAEAVSPDGSVVVGTGIDREGNRQAFRWAMQEGFHELGDFIPSGLNAEGSVIVGAADVDSDRVHAVIWDEVNGMRDLKYVLEVDYGLDLEGWWLMQATDVSDDGTLIVGYGVNPTGHSEAFLARIPEPSVLVLTGIGLLVMVTLRRTHK